MSESVSTSEHIRLFQLPFCVSLFYQIIAYHLYSIIFMRVIGNLLGAGILSHIPGEIQHTYHSEQMKEVDKVINLKWEDLR